MRVFVSGYDDSGCGWYRSLEVYRTISSDIEFILSNEYKDCFDGQQFTVDAAILQRPVDGFMPCFCADMRRMGKVVVVETDDLLTNLPPESPVRAAYGKPEMAAYKACLHIADYIHTSTPELAKELGDKATVFPNAINLKKYDGKKVRTGAVMWSGSVTHSESLFIIRPVIEELLRRKIRVILMSDEAFIKTYFKESEYLTILKPVPVEQYYIYPKLADVFLTPLPDNRFNRSKSNLKVLEAAAWGVPSVSSDVIPYREFNKLSRGGNILVKKNRLRYWLQPILDLLSDDDLWKKHSELSYSAVKEHYNLEKINEKRAAWWDRVLNKNVVLQKESHGTS